MAITVNYFLNKSARDKGADKLAIIGRVTYSFIDASGPQKRRFKFGTGYSVAPKSFKAGRVNKSADSASHINSKLMEFSKRAEALYKQYEDNKAFPTEAGYKQALQSNVRHVTEARDFVADFQSFIEYHINKGSASTTIRNLKQTLLKLQEVATKKKHPLEYASINLQFYAKFLAYCNEVKVSDTQTGLKKNTVGGSIKLLKTFLNYATAEGWNKYQYYQHPQFKIINEKIPVVSLTEKEIEALAALDLTKRPRLRLTADYFLLGCETGLRFSDYSKISRDKIREVPGGYNLEVKTKKTGADVVAPLSKLAMDILARYNYQLPKPPANQTINYNLREVMKLAQIDKEISTHDARRSFATNQYKAGTPIKFIQLITGHATEMQLRAYIGIDLTENAEQVRASHSKYQIESKGLLNRNLKIA